MSLPRAPEVTPTTVEYLNAMFASHVEENRYALDHKEVGYRIVHDGCVYVIGGVYAFNRAAPQPGPNISWPSVHGDFVILTGQFPGTADGQVSARGISSGGNLFNYWLDAITPLSFTGLPRRVPGFKLTRRISL